MFTFLLAQVCFWTQPDGTVINLDSLCGGGSQTTVEAQIKQDPTTIQGTRQWWDQQLKPGSFLQNIYKQKYVEVYCANPQLKIPDRIELASDKAFKAASAYDKFPNGFLIIVATIEEINKELENGCR